MHAIHFVDDGELPEAHDFLFVEIPDGAMVFYRESALSPQTLEDSWAASRAVRDAATARDRRTLALASGS